MRCAICNGPIGLDSGPPDGWQLKDNRTVCHSCCVKNLNAIMERLDRIEPVIEKILQSEDDFADDPDLQVDPMYLKELREIFEQKT